MKVVLRWLNRLSALLTLYFVLVFFYVALTDALATPTLEFEFGGALISISLFFLTLYFSSKSEPVKTSTRSPLTPIRVLLLAVVVLAAFALIALEFHPPQRPEIHDFDLDPGAIASPGAQN